MCSTAPMGSLICSTRTQLRRNKPLSSSSSTAEKSTPGESTKLICLSSFTSCTSLVKPGVADTPTALDLLRLLISELLPTFGYPMIPTLMDFLILCEREKFLRMFSNAPAPTLPLWLSLLSRAPPTELLALNLSLVCPSLPFCCWVEALNATAGNSRRRCFNHASATRSGTRSGHESKMRAYMIHTQSRALRNDHSGELTNLVHHQDQTFGRTAVFVLKR